MRRPARALESAAPGSKLEVEIDPAACARCARGQGCGSGIFNVGIAPVRLSCHTLKEVAAGDALIVEFDDMGSHWLWLVCGSYGLPTLGLLLATSMASVYLPALAAVATPQSTFAGFRDLVLAVAAVSGLSGGLLAWRMMAPWVLMRLEKRLGLQTGRIVEADTHPLHPAFLSRSTCATRENP